MKRFINFILFVVIICPLHADFKIMGGINFSNYNVLPKEANTYWNYKMGFLGGIGFEKNITDKMHMEFDILFFQKGSNAEFSELPDIKWKYRLNVISFPLLLRNKFLDESSPYIVGGAEFSTILSHTAKFSGQEPTDLKESTSHFDFGLVFGCGYEIKLQEYLFFFIEGRYHYGLKNIMSTSFEEQSKKTRSILIIVGIKS